MNHSVSRRLNSTVSAVRVPEAQELILERAVEPFVHCVVLGSFDAGSIVFEAERAAGLIKMQVKLAAIVGLHVLNLAVQKDMEPAKEIACRGRAVGCIHSRKRNLGMPINGGQDIALLAFPVPNDRIETEEKAGERLSL